MKHVHMKFHMQEKMDTKKYENDISLCIPRVETKTTINKIRETINNLSLGIIEKVDIVPIKQNEQNYKKVFIHFKYWFDTERTKQIHNSLLNGKIIKVVYDQPFFWKISINKSKLIH